MQEGSADFTIVLGRPLSFEQRREQASRFFDDRVGHIYSYLQVWEQVQRIMKAVTGKDQQVRWFDSLGLRNEPVLEQDYPDIFYLLTASANVYEVSIASRHQQDWHVNQIELQSGMFRRNRVKRTYLGRGEVSSNLVINGEAPFSLPVGEDKRQKVEHKPLVAAVLISK